MKTQPALQRLHSRVTPDQHHLRTHANFPGERQSVSRLLLSVLQRADCTPVVWRRNTCASTHEQNGEKSVVYVRSSCVWGSLYVVLPVTGHGPIIRHGGCEVAWAQREQETYWYKTNVGAACWLLKKV
jgi:hypothetical protein